MPTTDTSTGFNPIALLGALAIPGLGHALGGDRKRGLCVGVGVLGLFFSGILVGGIDTIDSKEDRIWFFGQALVGPIAFGVDYLHQNHFKVIDPLTKQRRSAYPTEGRDPATGQATPGGTPPNRKSVGKMNEIGTLFSTIAGMVNLIAIIDAGFPSSRARRRVASTAGATT